MTGVELSAHPDLNLIVGKNAAGKTSLLEAIYYLGRGRSFRGATNRELIQSEADSFTLFAEVVSPEDPQHSHRIGTEVSRGTKTQRKDGRDAKTSDLVAAMPVQAIDPEIHQLIQGGPEQRRRFLDWGVFHVEPNYIQTWRTFKGALKQRNAALRQGSTPSAVKAWDEPLISSAKSLDLYRKSFLEQFNPQISSILSDMLPFEVKVSYLQGWREEVDLVTALNDSFARDQVLASTQVGPHRADLKLRIEGRSAKHRLSRGQQKLLGAALVIAQTHFVASALNRRVVLLVDDPAAELDAEHQEKLFELLQGVPAQLFITSLDPAGIGWENAGKTFVIEAGKLAPLV